MYSKVSQSSAVIAFASPAGHGVAVPLPSSGATGVAALPTAPNGSSSSTTYLAFDRLHPSILERVYCALFPHNSTRDPTGGGGGEEIRDLTADPSWTSSVVGCFLAVELFSQGGRRGGGGGAGSNGSAKSKRRADERTNSASSVALTLTLNQLVVVVIEGSAAVSHTVNLFSEGCLREVIVEHLYYQDNDSAFEGSSVKYGDDHMRTLHTVCITYDRRTSNSGGVTAYASGRAGKPSVGVPAMIHLHFPSSSEYKGFMYALGSLIATMYPHHGVGIRWEENSIVVGDNRSSTVADHAFGNSVVAELSQLAGIAALPGSLLARGEADVSKSGSPLRASSPFNPSSGAYYALREDRDIVDIVPFMSQWGSIDRSYAQIEGVGAFYHQHNSSNGNMNSSPTLSGEREGMVGPALAVAVTEDDLERARQHVDAVEASILLSYGQLMRDVRGAIAYLRQTSLRTAKERAKAVARLAKQEDKRLSEEVLPREREAAEAVRTLERRRAEHSASLVDSYQELSQWANLEQHCRRIEVQRLQSMKDTQQRNLDAVADRRAVVEGLNEELWGLKEAIEAFESRTYTDLTNERRRLLDDINAEKRAEGALREELSETKTTATKAEKELIGTLSGLRRTIREAEDDARVARAKGEQLLSEAVFTAGELIKQQRLVENELERRLQSIREEANEASTIVSELEEEKASLESILKEEKLTQEERGAAADYANGSVTGRGPFSPSNDMYDAPHTSAYPNELNSSYSDPVPSRGARGIVDNTPSGQGQYYSYPSSSFLSDQWPTAAAAATTPPLEIVRGNRKRWDLAFIPKSQQRPRPSTTTTNNNINLSSSSSTAASRSLLLSERPSSYSQRTRDATFLASSLVNGEVKVGPTSVSPQQRRVSCGTMYLVEKAKADEAAAQRLSTESEAKLRMEERLQSIRDQLQSTLNRKY